MPGVLREMVGFDSNNFANVGIGASGGGSVSAAISAAPPLERNMRNRFKPRLHAKGISSLSNIPENRRKFDGIGELNRRLSDMKEEPGLNTDFNTRLHVPYNPSPSQTINNIVRRDSMTSNASSFYYSMKSADVSRRSSQASQYSVVLSPPTATATIGLYGMRTNSNSFANNYNTSSFYDPISPGSSRRSSQMSTVTTGGQSLPPQPSSTLLTSHLQRLQNSSLEHNTGPHSHSGRYSIPNTATISNGHISNQLSAGMNDRRMSEPLNRICEKEPLSPTRRPRSVTPKPTKTSVLGGSNMSSFATEYHPNQEVILDEVQEGEMVEDKLIIPEEFLDYLNQVDCANQTTSDSAAASKKKSTQTAAIKSDSSTADNPVCQNPNIWRNPPSNLYSIASPSTQPQSPASAISQIMSPDPMPHNAMVHTPNTYQMKMPVQQNDVAVNNPMMNFSNQPSQNDKPYYNYTNEQQQQQLQQQQQQQPQQPFTQSMYTNTFAQNTSCRQLNSSVANANAAGTHQNGTYNLGAVNGYSSNNMRLGGVSLQPANACTQTPGYFHRTDQSAMNCCQLLSALQISEDVSQKTKQESVNPSFRLPIATNTQNSTVINYEANSNQAQHLAEIQCGDISQSQMSPAVPMRAAHNIQNRMISAPQAQQRPAESQQQPQQQIETVLNQPSLGYQEANSNNIPRCECINESNEQTQQPCMYHSGMRQDTYQRTLEYVQSVQTQSWVENAEIVTSSTHPSSNMIINDMTTSLNSLLEENRYLQMIQ